MSEVTIDIAVVEDAPLGATIDDKLMVTEVQTGTMADGKLKVGDTVVQINDAPVRDATHLNTLLRRARIARLLVLRPAVAKSEQSGAMQPTHRDPHFCYYAVRMTWKDGQKLGLGIKEMQARVLVSRLEEQSLSAASLLVGDHLVQIDGQPVEEQAKAKQLLLQALQENGAVSLMVARPESQEAKAWTSRALFASTSQPPSVTMPSDVQDIAKRQQDKMRQSAPGAKQPILQQQTRPSGAVRIAFREGHVEAPIASDNEGKQLRPVKGVYAAPPTK